MSAKDVAAIAVALVGLLACKGRNHPPAVDASPATSAVAATSASPPAPPSASSSPAAGPSAPPSAAPIASAVDAGPSLCRLVLGPLPQPRRGAATFAAAGQGLDLWFNDDGRPHRIELPVTPVERATKPAAVPREPHAPEETPRAATYPPCAVAGGFAFCPDKSGLVRRWPIGGGEPAVVASARAGTRIDAAMLGGQPAVAYLASRKTSEGFVSEAWLAVGDTPPTRLCEDGSGATSVDLAPRGDHLVAMMLDARSALTAVHAREVSYDRTLVLGEDAVVFVGGPSERHTAAAIATPAAGAGFVLLPIAKDGTSFGLASIRVDSPPIVDAPMTWSMYANGLDPAPIAATEGAPTMMVARVRPAGDEPAAPRVLELGKLGADGTFAPLGLVPTHGPVVDLAIQTDRFGAVWLYYSDPSGGWVERRVCAPAT